MVKNELDILNKFAIRAPHSHGQLGECAAELLRDLRPRDVGCPAWLELADSSRQGTC
jgi:hypothetical protein